MSKFDPKELTDALESLYQPEGCWLWLSHPHKLLYGRSALDVLLNDDDGHEKIMQLIQQLITGSFA